MSSPLHAPARTSETTGRRPAVPRLAESAIARARLSVVPRLRSRAPRMPFVTLVSLVLLAGVLGLLLFNTSMQQASFTATSLEKQASDLSARQQALAMDIDSLRDPQRLAEAARKQGLVPATGAAYLDLETGEVTGEATPVTGEDDLDIEPPAPTPPAPPAPVEVEVPSDPVRLQGTGDRAGEQRDEQGRQRDRRAGEDRARGRSGESRGTSAARNDDRSGR